MSPKLFEAVWSLLVMSRPPSKTCPMGLHSQETVRARRLSTAEPFASMLMMHVGSVDKQTLQARFKLGGQRKVLLASQTPSACLACRLCKGSQTSRALCNLGAQPSSFSGFSSVLRTKRPRILDASMLVKLNGFDDAYGVLRFTTHNQAATI